jgi:hypothetical protein
VEIHNQLKNYIMVHLIYFEELKPNTPRGCDEFNAQYGIYLSSNKIELKLYSLARDKERNNRNCGIKNGFLYLRKERWKHKYHEKDKPLYKLNDVGYLYIIHSSNYEQNPNNLNEYVIKGSIKPNKIIKVYYKDVKKYIKYVSKEEMYKIFS